LKTVVLVNISCIFPGFLDESPKEQHILFCLFVYFCL